MQIIEMCLAHECTWSDNTPVYYLPVGKNNFQKWYSAQLFACKTSQDFKYYVFSKDVDISEEGFLGVDEKNQTFIFAAPTSKPKTYNYFICSLDDLITTCHYNPNATFKLFVEHFDSAPKSSHQWLRPFILFKHENWVETGVSAAPSAPPKPKYKWTLTKQGVAYS